MASKKIKKVVDTYSPSEDEPQKDTKNTKTVKKVSKTKMDLAIYTDKIEGKIKHVLEAKNAVNCIEDILLNEYIAKHINEINNSLIIKQLQMKVGNIWQIAIGNYIDFRDLGVGHHTGLDVKNKNRKIIMELKNRYNTDNASAKKSNFDKLAKYKRDHSDFECIYAIMNDRKPKGQHKTFEHNGVELVYFSGMCLLEHVFGEETNAILNILHKIIDSHIS
jgi:hypothetical protein